MRERVREFYLPHHSLYVLYSFLFHFTPSIVAFDKHPTYIFALHRLAVHLKTEKLHLDYCSGAAQIQENMKAINVIPLLTPAVLEKIEAVVQSKPKRPDSYR